MGFPNGTRVIIRDMNGNSLHRAELDLQLAPGYAPVTYYNEHEDALVVVVVPREEE